MFLPRLFQLQDFVRNLQPKAEEISVAQPRGIWVYGAYDENRGKFAQSGHCEDCHLPEDITQLVFGDYALNLFYRKSGDKIVPVEREVSRSSSLDTVDLIGQDVTKPEAAFVMSEDESDKRIYGRNLDYATILAELIFKK